MKLYPSLEAFYSADEARRRSPEADYGVWWQSEHGPGFCSVSYVRDTGEVYAVRLPNEDNVEVLGIMPPDPDDGKRPSKHTYYRTLDRILDGWANHCGRPGGLAWVRSKLVLNGFTKCQ